MRYLNQNRKSKKNISKIERQDFSFYIFCFLDPSYSVNLVVSANTRPSKERPSFKMVEDSSKSVDEKRDQDAGIMNNLINGS